MKKIVSLLMGLVVLATATFAQPKMQSKKEEKASAAKQVKPAEIKPAPAPVAAPKMKKDGTADRRFKDAKKTEGPMKKDGTLDKRFKANKPAAKKATQNY